MTSDEGIEIIGVYHGALDIARRLKGSGADSVNE